MGSITPEIKDRDTEGGSQKVPTDTLEKVEGNDNLIIVLLFLKPTNI